MSVAGRIVQALAAAGMAVLALILVVTGLGD
jgi:hypothetical protein